MKLSFIKNVPKRHMRAVEQIQNLDLTMIKKKLSLPEPEGKGWPEEVLLEVEVWYKRFLCLSILEPSLSIVPNLPIDEMWHAHILDTGKYARDCNAIYNKSTVLEHYPYFGLNGPEDAANRDAAFDETNVAYEKWFGANCKSMPFYQDHFDTQISAGSKCNSGGSGTGCGQGCGKKRSSITSSGSKCNSGGSGTGCGQGCSKKRQAVKHEVLSQHCRGVDSAPTNPVCKAGTGGSTEDEE